MLLVKSEYTIIRLLIKAIYFTVGKISTGFFYGQQGVDLIKECLLAPVAQLDRATDF